MKYLHEIFTKSKNVKRAKKLITSKKALNKGKRNVDISVPGRTTFTLNPHPYSVATKSHSIIAISLKISSHHFIFSNITFLNYFEVILYNTS